MTISIDRPDLVGHRTLTRRRPRAVVAAAVAASATLVAFVDVVLPVGGFPVPGVPPKPMSSDAVAAALGLPAGTPVPPEVMASIPTTLTPEVARPLLQGPLEAYAAGFAVFLLVTSILTGRMRARLFPLALTVFALASAASAMAHDAHLLFGCLAVQGVAAGLVMASALVALAQPTPNAPVSTGAWWVIAAAGIGIGPTAGAFLAGKLAWTPQTEYAVQALVLAVLTAAAWWAVPGDDARRRGRSFAPALVSAAVLAAVATIATIVHPHPCRPRDRTGRLGPRCGRTLDMGGSLHRPGSSTGFRYDCAKPRTRCRGGGPAGLTDTAPDARRRHAGLLQPPAPRPRSEPRPTCSEESP
ncbi:MFS transporter [Nocardia sp. NPDC059246]|uniref:MFS transporter n=1 Tax=unclassified Nocardia TaxID=2637762 RepID=UPI003688FDE0